MNQLVFVKNNEVVTDSLTVAEVFGKRHDNVLVDIENQIEKLNQAGEQEFSLLNFQESTYQNERGRTYRKAILTEEAFTIIAMSYVTPEAMKMKVKFIQEFKKMRDQLNGHPRILSEKEQLKASMKLSIQTSEELDQVKEKVNYLEEKMNEQITLSHGEQISLQHSVKKRVEKLWDDGIKGTLESKTQMYSKIHSQLKRAFQAPSYRVVKRKDFNEAIAWVSAWRPL